MAFLKSLFSGGQKIKPKTKVALITNYTACPLGMSMLDRLAESHQHVVAVAHNASQVASSDHTKSLEHVSVFDAFPNEEEDRNRLVSFLHSKEMVVSTLVQN